MYVHMTCKYLRMYMCIPLLSDVANSTVLRGTVPYQNEN